MEESKAAAYYDELTRKGEGAAKFKRGLGFSASDSNNELVSASKGSALPSSSSFLSSFVKASSPSKASEFEKQAQLEAIQNKLKKKKPSSPEEEERHSRVLERDNRGSSHRRRSLSRDRDGQQHSRRRSRSQDRYRDKYRDRDRDRRRSRSRDRWRPRSRSSSPRGDNGRSGGRKKSQHDRKVERLKTEKVDYSRLIEGYENMSPAERVKAKLKLQLAETAKMDETKGVGPGWERFEFNKDAPLDDEEIEAVEDDAALVKHIGQSFRFSAIEAKKEEQIKAAHDEAMFGAPIGQISSTTDSEVEAENDKVEESCKSGSATSLLSEKVLAKQQGSWRDRARRV